MNNSYRYAGRVHSRRYAMQALYEHQMTGRSLDKISDDYRYDDEVRGKMDAAYFGYLIDGVEANKSVLIKRLEKITGYSFDRIDPVEQAVMLCTACELLYVPKTEASVVIAEAVKINKKYGSQEGYRLVHGVLNCLATSAAGEEGEGAEEKA